MEETPSWVVAVIFFMVVMVAAVFASLAVTFFAVLWEKYKNHKSEDEGDDFGGGGWSPDPVDPVGGGGNWLNLNEFHRELDLIGKSIEAEKEQESVLSLGACYE